MLDAHRLMIFRSVAVTGSVAAAAASLGYTSSAVSQHVSALQRETGLQLVERVGRGVELTPAGKVLAAEAEEVLTRLTAIGSTVEDLRAGKASRVTMNVFASAGTYWLPDVVATLARDFPDTRLRLRIEDQVTEISTRRPDIAVIVSPDDAVEVTGYSYTKLLSEPYVAVVPADHELAEREVIETGELARYAWVDNDVRRGPCRASMIAACAAAGFTPKFVLETTDYPSALRFVARGVGITMLPRLGATELPAGTVAIAVVNPQAWRTIGMYIKDSESASPVVQHAAELLRRAAQS